MRIWHDKLTPKLCRQHLLGMWREGLGIYSIITKNKKGYRHHPAVKEWEGRSFTLFQKLCQVRKEMVKRGYRPKVIFYNGDNLEQEDKKPSFIWQTLAQQVKILKTKKCICRL